MNVYATKFFGHCPSNNIRIEYDLRIESMHTIRVESILTEVESIGDAFHEEIATELQLRLGGRHTLEAMHHGVHITTTRGDDKDPPNGG